jgi:choline/glycine/proline betaine transport protein
LAKCFDRLYWGWWIAWSPFVGIFARISKGRTVREFILGVLLVPSIVTFSGFQLLKFSCASSVAW